MTPKGKEVHFLLDDHLVPPSLNGYNLTIPGYGVIFSTILTVSNHLLHAMGTNIGWDRFDP